MPQANVILTVSDVMGWSRMDAQALTKWLNAYANLLGKNTEEQAVQMVKNALMLEGDFPAHDINRWLYAVINLIFYELLSALRVYDDTKHTNLKQIEKSFSPCINFSASHFNNCFDNVGFEQEREAIVAQALMMLSNSFSR